MDTSSSNTGTLSWLVHRILLLPEGPPRKSSQESSSWVLADWLQSPPRKVKESVSMSPSQRPGGGGTSLQSSPSSLTQVMVTSTRHFPVGGSVGGSVGGFVPVGREVGGGVSLQPYSPGLQVGRGVGGLVIEEP